MKHTTWLQNCTPACAINGKTPYKMQHNKKPHLAGIQEFRVAAYVKDLKAGKLDARAKVGRFVGYDLESKGYQIYWPQKRSITVERNVVFNESDVTANDNIHITPGNAVDKGERDKILQPPTSNANATNAPNSAPCYNFTFHAYHIRTYPTFLHLNPRCHYDIIMTSFSTITSL